MIGGMSMLPVGKPSIVVFDIGNVIVEWDPRNLFRKMFSATSEMEYFLAHVCNMAWNLEIDGGRRFADAVTERIAEFPEYERAIRAFDERWNEMVPGLVPGMLALVERLDALGVPLYAITNCSAEKYLAQRLRFPVFDLFRGVVVSAHEGTLKPDLKIFELLLMRYGLRAEDCLMVDDSAANVVAARTIGMTAHHFRMAATLEEELLTCGLL